jgi:hypothetical protein
MASSKPEKKPEKKGKLLDEYEKDVCIIFISYF